MWAWVQPVVLDIRILIIAEFLVAGVGGNTQAARSHLPSSYTCSLDICAKPFRNSLLCQTSL